jgi:uncharacterized protein (TIGR02594 family)
MKWFEIAEKERGVHETPGPKATERIVEYHAATTLKATSDEVPWCSSFVNWCMRQAGEKPTGSAAARSWLSWGEPCDPKKGCVIVIRRKMAGHDKATGSMTGFHVGFFEGLTPTHVQILGGNQGDSVKSSNFPLNKYEIMGFRQPKTESKEVANV